MLTKNITTLITLASLLLFPSSPAQDQSLENKRSTSGYLQYSKKYTLELQERKCITDVLLSEAQGESKVGIDAVMSVVINRKNSVGFPSSFCKVIYQRNQFSAFNKYNGKIQKVSTKALNGHSLGNNVGSKGYIAKVALKASMGVFKLTLPKNVMYFHNTTVEPQWIRGMIHHKTIGNHLFYSVG